MIFEQLAITLEASLGFRWLFVHEVKYSDVQNLIG